MTTTQLQWRTNGFRSCFEAGIFGEDTSDRADYTYSITRDFELPYFGADGKSRREEERGAVHYDVVVLRELYAGRPGLTKPLGTAATLDEAKALCEAHAATLLT